VSQLDPFFVAVVLDGRVLLTLWFGLGSNAVFITSAYKVTMN
jgi:hypothetical protein